MSNLRILLTNDDGFHADGLLHTRRALAGLGNVDAVAPKIEQSGKSHSITYREPLFVHEVTDTHHPGWIVDGTPADCVRLGVTQLYDYRHDLVVSGINHGLNAGLNILYSGTVAAAREAAFWGIPSVAVSLEVGGVPDWDRVAALAVEVVSGLLEENAFEHSTMFNINIPLAALGGSYEVQWVPMGCHPYGDQFVRRLDPKGGAYFWATGDPPPKPTEYYSDLSALDAGAVAVTPLSFDLTHYNALPARESSDGEADAGQTPQVAARGTHK